MRGTGLKIGRVFGIPIFVHLSWFLIFVLITYSLGDEFGARYPQWSSRELWTLGILTSLLFFGSVLFHELSHSVVARHYKIPVASITLFFFGGIASITRDPDRAGQEFLIAAAGPASSYVLAGGFYLLSLRDSGWKHAERAGRMACGNQSAAGNLQPFARLSAGRRTHLPFHHLGNHQELFPLHAHRGADRTGHRRRDDGFRTVSGPSVSRQCERRVVYLPGLVPAYGGAAKLRADHDAGRSARAARDRRDDLGDAYDWPRSHPRRVRARGGAHGKAGASGGVRRQAGRADALGGAASDSTRGMVIDFGAGGDASARTAAVGRAGRTGSQCSRTHAIRECGSTGSGSRRQRGGSGDSRFHFANRAGARRSRPRDE